MLMRGSEFKKIYGDKFVKAIKKDFKHYNHQYVHGLNIDAVPFNPSGYCAKGGLYFTTEKFLFKFISGCIYAVNVSIPDDAQVYIDPEKEAFKADKIIVDLDNKILLENYPGLYKKLIKNITGENIKFIPEKFRTNELYLNIAKKDIYALLFIPPDKITDEICAITAKHKNHALYDIPNKKRTVGICLIAIKYKYVDLNHICFTPNKIITDKMCEETINKYHYASEYVPKEKITPVMCMIAVKSCGYSLQYVPKELITEEMCICAVKSCGYALKFVPSEMISYNMCVRAVSNCADALAYVPEKYKTHEIYLSAVKNNSWAIILVPEEEKTTDICLITVINSKYIFQQLSEDKKSFEICLAAVKCSKMNLAFVPEIYKKRISKILKI